VAVGDGGGLGGADVGDADQFNIRQAGQYAGVGLAEVPDADDGHPQAGHGAVTPG
jgi:hypothetical protein